MKGERYTRRAAKEKFKVLEGLYELSGRDTDVLRKTFPLYWKVVKAYRDALIEASQDDKVLNCLCSELTSLAYPHENMFALAEMLSEAGVENYITRYRERRDNAREYVKRYVECRQTLTQRGKDGSGDQSE